MVPFDRYQILCYFAGMLQLELLQLEFYYSVGHIM